MQIEFSLLCNQQGCPVAVTVFEGNTSDSQTLKPQLEKLTERFGIKHGIFVGDRGTLPDTQISKQLKDLEGWDWITALRAAQIRKLLDEGALKLEEFETQSWIEIQSQIYPNERLIACLNRHLANQTKKSSKNKFGLFGLIVESPRLSVGLLRPNLFPGRS